ncbi:hypothetical protein R1sor_022291 [Riccia sorocarpa]|uniref:26S proteasome non-ATPase regulatory subunit 11 n=1 Tax=Riccia sorocarpa TaxID=122646 RepID=A0ABD3GJF0_9MARC
MSLENPQHPTPFPTTSPAPKKRSLPKAAPAPPSGPTTRATSDELARATEIQDTDPDEAISILRAILHDPTSTAEALRVKEQAIAALSDLLSQQKKGEELRGLLTDLRPFFSFIPKAKTAKIVRGIIDAVAKIPGTSDLQISLCREMVEWTRAEKRTFLRQRVEARLAALLMESKEYSEALSLLTNLVREVRRLDDKLLLVDIDLLESKLHFSLRNLPKAKAALTAARTAANAIYVPPAQQGTIDLQSGILHAEEKDYKTAFSYFFEAFEAFNALDDPRAVFSLKYMLLCKIMTNSAEDVGGLISSKAGLKYTGVELDAMKAVAEAYVDAVEKKLSQMILDKKFAGTLDQGAGCLIIFDDVKPDGIYPATLETIGNISKVVDSLYLKSAKIMA